MADRPTECAECGEPIVPNAIGRPRRFCCDACKRRANNRRVSRARLPTSTTVEKVCPVCGKAFLAKRRNRVYCYDGWCNQESYRRRVRAGQAGRIGERVVECDECGESFKASRPEARWCSKACANRHWGRVRARQKRTPSAANYTDREIFNRDGWRCHICGQKVRQDVGRTHPDGATIDHIIPIARGGDDEPSNVATAHWRCNRDKRDGAADDQLRLM